MEAADWDAWKKEIKESIQTLKNKSKKIENQIKNKQIEVAIIQKCIDFKDN